MSDHIAKGKRGEKLAVKFLEAKGYTIFDCNYNFQKAEIDIVAYKPTLLHFVEVKTRSNSELNDPELTVGKQKQKHLAKAGSIYIWERQLNNMPAVFDIIAVGLDDPDNPVFRHYEDVFQPANPYF